MASPAQLKVLLDLSDGVTFNETSSDCFDISDLIMSAHTRRGRSQELDKIESGYAVITVIDDNGDFNPDNLDSPYFGKLKPGNKIRLYPLYDDGTGEFRYPDIFTGYITNYLNRFSMGVDSANEVVIEASDAFKIFNSYSITNVVNSTSGDSSDERIDAILDEISWPASLRMFETSALSLAADQGDLRTVLDAVRQVEDTEAGLFYIDGSGVAQFKNRATVNTAPDLNDAYIFSDDGTEISYNGISFSQNDNILINRLTVRSYDGTNEVTVYDSTSETSYFSRSAERNNVLLTSITDLTDLAEQLLVNFKDSNVDVKSITLNLTDYEQIDRVVTAFYLDIFFVPVAVYKTMPNATSINRLGWIQGVNHDITKNSWMVTAFTGLTQPEYTYWLASTTNGTGLPEFSNVQKTSNGNIYLIAQNGYISGGFWVVYLDRQGRFIWAYLYEGDLNWGPFQTQIDAEDNLYVGCGSLTGGKGRLIKIDTNGTVLWDLKSPYGWCLSIGVSSSKIYIASYPVVGASSYNTITALNYDGTSNMQCLLSSMRANYIAYGNDAIYIASPTKEICKLNTDGTLAWSYTIGNASTDFNIADLKINPVTGYIWIYAAKDSGPANIQLIQIEDEGVSASIVYQKEFDVSNQGFQYGNPLTFDPSGNTYVLIRISDNVIISKFDTSNAVSWQRKKTNSTSGASINAPSDNYFYLASSYQLGYLPSDGTKTATYNFPTATKQFIYENDSISLSDTSYTLDTLSCTSTTVSEAFTYNLITRNGQSNVMIRQDI